MNNGFVKVAAAMPRVRVADCAYNTDSIMSLMAQAEGGNQAAAPRSGVCSYST